jgi:hypothetical protein
MIILPHMEEEIRRMTLACEWPNPGVYAYVFTITQHCEVGSPRDSLLTNYYEA